MASLHIEHAITDLTTWTAAFSAFAGAREQAGVLAEQVRQPVGDPHHVVVDLEFDTVARAEAFLSFLQTSVWAVPANSPALVGSPEAKVLETVKLS